jgi:hypothetical protein
MDVARKLVILGREMGWSCRSPTCASRAWCRPASRRARSTNSWRDCPSTTPRCGSASRRRRARGKVLRYVGRLAADGTATVGVVELDARHAFANIALTDNVVRFATEPLLQQSADRAGPGRRSRSHGRRHLRRSAAALRLSRSAPVNLSRPSHCLRTGLGRQRRDRFRHPRLRGRRARRPHHRDALADAGVRITGCDRGVVHRPAARAGAQHRGPRAAGAEQGAEAGFRLRDAHREGHSAGLGPRRFGGLGRRRRGRGQRAARQPLRNLELLKFAMQGEAVASGSVHVDNIAPSLFGGLVLTVGIDNPRVKQIPVPTGAWP